LSVDDVSLLLEDGEMLVDCRPADSEMIGHLIDGYSLFAIEQQRQNQSPRIAANGFQRRPF